MIPRSLFIDSDSVSSDTVRSSSLGKLFSPDNYICNNSGGTGKVFAKGKLCEGSELSDLAIDSVNREMEKCDNPLGFHLLFSSQGGVGSGSLLKVAENIRQYYCSKVISNFNILPDECEQYNALNIYNSVLLFPTLISNSDLNFCFDNNSLRNVCRDNSVLEPSFNDINGLVSSVISASSASSRFPGFNSSNLRKLAVNLNNFIRLMFYSPIYAYESSTNFTDLCSKLFERKSALFNSQNMNKGTILTAAALFRGNMTSYDFEYNLVEFKKRNYQEYYRHFPHSFTTSHSFYQPNGKGLSSVIIRNSSSICNYLKWLAKQFSIFHSKKFYLHLYLQHGMDEMEFLEAQTDLNDLIIEYESCIDKGIEENIDEENEDN
jgi:tubulin beta